MNIYLTRRQIALAACEPICTHSMYVNVVNDGMWTLQINSKQTDREREREAKAKQWSLNGRHTHHSTVKGKCSST